MGNQPLLDKIQTETEFATLSVKPAAQHGLAFETIHFLLKLCGDTFSFETMRYIALEFEKFIQSESKETLRISRYLVEPMLNALSLVCAVWTNTLPHQFRIHFFSQQNVIVFGFFFFVFLFVFTFHSSDIHRVCLYLWSFKIEFYCFCVYLYFHWVSSVVLRWTGDRPQHI